MLTWEVGLWQKGGSSKNKKTKISIFMTTSLRFYTRCYRRTTVRPMLGWLNNSLPNKMGKICFPEKKEKKRKNSYWTVPAFLLHIHTWLLLSMIMAWIFYQKRYVLQAERYNSYHLNKEAKWKQKSWRRVADLHIIFNWWSISSASGSVPFRPLWQMTSLWPKRESRSTLVL